MTTNYERPPKILADLIDCEENPFLSLSPDRNVLLIREQPGHTPIRDIAEIQEVRCAGIRFDAAKRCGARASWSLWAKLQFLDDARRGRPPVEIRFANPARRMRSFSFSPNSKYLAFVVDVLGGTSGGDLYLAEVETGVVRLVSQHANNILTSYIFSNDSQWLYFTRIPPSKRRLYASPPSTPIPTQRVPRGPIVSESVPNQKNPARTYVDLLKTEEDEAVMEHYTASELVAFRLDSGVETVLVGEAVVYSFQPGPTPPPSPAAVREEEIINKKEDLPLRFLLVQSVVKPYSNMLPLARFSRLTEVIEIVSRLDHTISLTRSELYLSKTQEDLSTSFDARLRGPRDIEWVWDHPPSVSSPRSANNATGKQHYPSLVYIESMDGGDPTAATDERDAVWIVDAYPYVLDKAQNRKVFQGTYRIDSVKFADRGSALWVEESWYKTRRSRVSWVGLTPEARPPRVLFDRSSEDLYTDPGSPKVERDPRTGNYRMKPAEGETNKVFLFGDGHSPLGTRPFVDVYDVTTGERARRIFRSPIGASLTSREIQEALAKTKSVAEGGVREEVESELASGVMSREDAFVRPIDVKVGSAGELLIVATRETETEPPNVVAVDARDGTLIARYTDLPHPQPAMLRIQKRIVHYTRADGVALQAELFLERGSPWAKVAEEKLSGGLNNRGEPSIAIPPEQRLPVLLWAYPHEYKSKANAGVMKTSPYRFVRTGWSSPVMFALRGVAVLNNFSCPVVGEGDAEPNDTFVAQIVASAESAVNFVCGDQARGGLGIGDASKVAVGGHSYGAFLCAHLLSHTRLFRCGIARSGAYNRTLTPFSFQSEERTFWEAKETYMEMSPFAHADKVESPLLLIHGSMDENAGTHTMQSERYFAALQGLGKPARLVVLPLERHGYEALESVLHVIYEEDTFLRKCLGIVDRSSAEEEATGQEEEGNVATTMTGSKRARF